MKFNKDLSKYKHYRETINTCWMNYISKYLICPNGR